MKKLLCLVVLLALLSCPLLAADKKIVPSLSAARDLNKEFLGLIVDSQFDQAFDLIKSYMATPEKEIDNLKAVTVQQYQTLEASFGKPFGYQLVSERKVQDRLMIYTYLELREKFPLRWTIIYYRPQVSWLPVIWKWDARITDL